MSRDVIVYTQREGGIPIDEILTRMRARGMPVEWHYRLLSERNQPANWTSGYFLPDGKSQPQVSVSKEEVKPEMRDETLQAYADVMTELHRQLLDRAMTKYQLVPDGTPELEAERILVNLADIIAEIGNGVILDVNTDRFYVLQEYRTLHSLNN